MTFFSDQLRSLRLKNNWKQSDLAEKINVTQESISQFENELRNPKDLTIEKLCTVFNVTIQDLTGTESGYSFEKEILIKKLEDLDPDSIREINEYAEFLIKKEREKKKKQKF